MKNLCIITTRKGSKRLKNKNILLMNNKPMVLYTVEESINSGVFENIVVATDDDKVIEILLNYNVEIIKLPQTLTMDNVFATESCLFVIEQLSKQNKYYDNIWLLQPTSPLRTKNDIVGAYKLFSNKKCDYLISTTEIDPHYFHWSLKKNEHNENYTMFFGSKFLQDRNLLPKIYRPNGSIKIANLKKFIFQKNFFGENLETYETPEERSIHVATLFEFKLCEYILKNKLNENIYNNTSKN